jgi:hypothetical protein
VNLRMTIPDVEASCDVLVDVQDASDSMTPEQCIEYRVACEAVLKAAKTAIDLLNMQFVKISETDVIRDGRRFYVGRKKDRERFDHDLIEATVVAEAVDRSEADDGERFVARTAARAAADLMRRLYITDSTSAKISALNALGLNTDRQNPRSVRTWEQGDRAVFDIPAGGEQPAETVVHLPGDAP